MVNIAPLDRDFRRECFELLLAWCGHGPSSAAHAEKEHKHRLLMLQKLKHQYVMHIDWVGVAYVWRYMSELLYLDVKFVTPCSPKGHLLDASYHQKRRLLCHATLQAMAALLLGECFDTSTASSAVSVASSSSSSLASLTSSAVYAPSVAGSASTNAMPSLDLSPMKNAVYPWLRDIVRSSDAQVSRICECVFFGFV